MLRIDTSTAAATLPTPAAAGTAGYFTEGNPGTGVPATVLSADWLNLLQDELMALLTAASITPSKTNRTQVLASIRAIGGRGALLCLTASGSTTSGTELAIPFPAAVYDDMSFYSSGQPTRLTVPSGVSRIKITGQVMYAANGAGGRRKLRIRKNGSGEGIGLPAVQNAYPDLTDTTTISIASTIYPVAAGDYFESMAYQDSGAAVALAPAIMTWFAIEAVR